MATWKYSDQFVTDRVTCDDCQGDLVLDEHPAELTVYTRGGTQYSQHFTKVCPTRWCRKRFYYGYSIKNKEKIYEKID